MWLISKYVKFDFDQIISASSETANATNVFGNISCLFHGFCGLQWVRRGLPVGNFHIFESAAYNHLYKAADAWLGHGDTHWESSWDVVRVVPPPRPDRHQAKVSYGSCLQACQSLTLVAVIVKRFL